MSFPPRAPTRLLQRYASAILNGVRNRGIYSVIDAFLLSYNFVEGRACLSLPRTPAPAWLATADTRAFRYPEGSAVSPNEATNPHPFLEASNTDNAAEHTRCHREQAVVSNCRRGKCVYRRDHGCCTRRLCGQDITTTKENIIAKYKICITSNGAEPAPHLCGWH